MSRWSFDRRLSADESRIRGAYGPHAKPAVSGVAVGGGLPHGRPHQPDGDEEGDQADRIRPPGGDFPRGADHGDRLLDEGL